jgi:integrase
MTEKKRLTDNLLKKLEHNGKEYVIWDSTQPGLCIKVGAVRGKTFAVKFRVGKGRGGIQKFPKLGSWPTVSIDDARSKASELVSAGWQNVDLLQQQEAAQAAAKAAKDAEHAAYYKAANPADTAFLKTVWMQYAKLKKQSLAEKTHKNLVRRFSHIAAVLGDDIKTADIKVIDVENIRDYLGDKRVEFNQTLASLSAVMASEVYEGRIERNACKRVKPYPAKYREVVLTDTGVKDFVRYFNDLSNFETHRHNYARFLLVMLYTGFRNRMLASLMKKDNGENNYLDGAVAVFRKHKTAHRNAKPERVQVSKKALEIMNAAMEATPDNPYVLGSHDSREYYKLRPLNPTIIEKMANSVAGMFETEGDGKFTAYSLRHTFGTRLVEKGASIHAVSKAMLHADLRTTMRYVKSTEKSREDIANFIDESY